jgi:hypothetical protein
MAGQAKNLINNLYRFMHVLNVLLIRPNIATNDAFNKIGLNNISSSVQVKTQHQEILCYYQTCRESKRLHHLSKNQTTKVS